MGNEPIDLYDRWADAVRGQYRPPIERESRDLAEQARILRRAAADPEAVPPAEATLEELRRRADQLQRQIGAATERANRDQSERAAQRRREAGALLLEIESILLANGSRPWHELIAQADALGLPEGHPSWGMVPPARLTDCLPQLTQPARARAMIAAMATDAAADLASEADSIEQARVAEAQLVAIRAQRQELIRHLSTQHGMTAEVVAGVAKGAGKLGKFRQSLAVLARRADAERLLGLPEDVFGKSRVRDAAGGSP